MLLSLSPTLPWGEVKIEMILLTLGFAKAAFTYMKIMTSFCFLQIQV